MLESHMLHRWKISKKALEDSVSGLMACEKTRIDNL